MFEKKGGEKEREREKKERKTVVTYYFADLLEYK